MNNELKNEVNQNKEHEDNIYVYEKSLNIAECNLAYITKYRKSEV